MGTGRLSRNVGTELLLHGAQYLKRANVSDVCNYIDFWKWGLIGCPETSARNYHFTGRNISEERTSQMCAIILTFENGDW